MDREKKIGIILIVIGICIPLLVLPFLSGYSKDRGVIDNLYRAGIEIRKDKPGNAGSQPSGNIETTKSKFSYVLSRLIPKRIPFRFFLVITVIFLYMGIVRIDRSRRKEHSQDSESEEQDRQGIEPE